MHVDITRRLTHAIWHMLSHNQQFAPRRAAFGLPAWPPVLDLRPRAKHPISPDPPAEATGDRASLSWVTISESRNVEERRARAVPSKPFPSGWDIEGEVLGS
jgi:hypothetical protein